MTRFVDKKPALSKTMNILLAKLAQHLELTKVNHARFELRCDDEQFYITSVYFDDKEIQGNAPFRSGNIFQSFFDRIEEELRSTALDGNEDDDSQEFTLHFKGTPIGNEKTQWVTSFSYSETINKSDDQEHIREPDYFEDDPIHREIINFMKKHGADSMTYFFSGGGDSGDLNELSIEVDHSITEAKTILLEEAMDRVSFQSIAYDHCMKAVMTDIDNWYDGNGGSGSVCIDANGQRTINVSYDEYELEEVIADEPIALPIPISTTAKPGEIETSLELK